VSDTPESPSKKKARVLELDDDELDPSAYKGLKKAEIKKIQKERERKAKREAKEEEKKKAAERRRARGESGWRLGRGARACRR
jgi:SAGA-associated factor 73